MDVTRLLQNPRWGQALYLNERFEQLVQHDAAIDSNVDHSRIRDWLQKYNHDKELLEKRINAEGMDIKTFQKIVSSTNETLPYDYTQFEWYQELADIFSDKSYYDLERYIRVEKDEIPFFEFLVPFLNRTIRVFEEGLRDKDWRINRQRVIGLVLKMVMDKMFHLYTKTLIYELNKSRLHNELEGDDGRQRYEYFIQEKLATPEDILEILLQYPVLGRMMAESLRRIHQNMLLVIDRLIRDRMEIEKAFNVKLDKLEDIQVLGDSHNGGNSVLRLTFDNDVNLIYKPRNLAIDKGFARLLEWLNDKGINLPFKTVKSVNKKDYGWQQYISYRSCTDQKEVERFFERQGQYLAVLYVTNATDMHLENIIAQGEHPFFVDLESLFHHQAFTQFIEKEAYTAYEKTSFILNDSVLKTSMLPALDSNALYHSDLSGLAGDVEQIMNTYEVIDKNTDQMKIKRSKINITKAHHLPSYRNESISPKHYMTSVKKGFEHAYQLLSDHKYELIENMNKWFRGCIVRTIIRPTISYFTLLEASTHPKYLKNGLDKTLLLDYMWLIFKSDPGQNAPNREQATLCECLDLARGDIPLFKSIIGEKYLLHHVKIEGAYAQDILTSTFDKLRRMDEEDMQLQWEFIERTVRTKYLLEETHTMEKSVASVDFRSLNPEPDPVNLQNRCLNEAMRIGEYIKDIAVMGDDRSTISWISMGMDADEKLIYKSSELGLYNGVTGIGYFYLYLAKETGNESYANITDLCINTAFEMIEKRLDENISVFTGYGSLLYLLIHKQYLFADPDFMEKADKLMDLLEPMIETDDHLDIIAGCAGTLITFIDCYHLFRHERPLNWPKNVGNTF